MLHAPGDVVLHLASPSAIAGVEELLAEASGAAEVGGKHGIAAIGEELSEGRVAPVVTRPRAAMRHYQQGQVPRLDAARQREVRRDFQAVGRLVPNGLHFGHGIAWQFLTDAELELERASLA